MNVHIRKVKNEDSKADIVEEVLYDLPEWFGLPESTRNYINESRELPCFVAYADEETLGFITLKPTSDATAEIHAMGVKKEYHRYGIGKMLYEAFEDEAKKKFTYAQVKTVDEGYYESYDQTVAFYKSMGFVKLEVFPTMWDEWNPCLVMVKKLC